MKAGAAQTNAGARHLCRCRRSWCFAPRTKDAVDARIPPTVLSAGTGVEAVCAQIWKK